MSNELFNSIVPPSLSLLCFQGNPSLNRRKELKEQASGDAPLRRVSAESQAWGSRVGTHDDKLHKVIIAILLQGPVLKGLFSEEILITLRLFLVRPLLLLLF